jgi:tetratricopeptide (TPR) repeat protein
VRPAYETLAAMGEKARLSSRAALLAAIVYEQGRFDEAVRLAEEADAISAADDIEPQGWSRGVRAKALAQRGRIDEAEREARENVGLAEPTDWLLYRGMAWFDLGEVLRLGGRSREAAEAYRSAEMLYEEKGSTVLAAKARAAQESVGA